MRLRFRTAVLKTHCSRVWGWRRTDETASEGDGGGKNVSCMFLPVTAVVSSQTHHTCNALLHCCKTETLSRTLPRDDPHGVVRPRSQKPVE